MSDVDAAGQPIMGGPADWVWPSRMADLPNQYVQFRHEFVLGGDSSSGALCVSCDSNYAVWLNGRFVDCGQFHDYPDHKSCDVISLSGLKPGKHVLAFLVHYQGEGSFQYIKGAPGMVYVLATPELLVSSGSDVIYRVDPCYAQGPRDRITPQLGFTFEHNATADDDWRAVDYEPDATWTHPSAADLTTLDARPVKQVRPLPKLTLGERIRPRMVSQGLFLRKHGGDATVAQLMQLDYLSPRPRSAIFERSAVRSQAVGDADGVYLVLDLGREEVGFLQLDIEAGTGTVVDVAWGEHIDELRVRAHVGGRNFACRYVCREGRQSFAHYFTRLAGRYLQLHISHISDDTTIHYAGIIPVEYPIKVRGGFNSDDTLRQRIYDTCVRTLHLCMHEHYEDCPWREQALYAMDMRNQALAGYYCFGEYAFPAVSLDLLGKGLKSDGFLEMCAPAEIEITIPAFTFAWVLAVADHHLHSGDTDAARRFFPIITQVMEKRAQAAEDGLLPCPAGPRYWHFYDWADGLDGSGRRDIAADADSGNTRYDAPLNLFYCLALEAAARVADAVGEKRLEKTYLARVADLKPRIHRKFWDASDNSYLSFVGAGAPKHRSELVQALAILSGVCDRDAAATLRERLARRENGLVKTTLSYTLYKFEALLTDPVTYGKRVFDAIAADWGHMLYQGATSFWETINGADDFGGAGSLCHGWSGIPAYFYHAYLLGVKPTSPGFETYAHQPLEHCGSPVTGVVPTPRGVITVGPAGAQRARDEGS